MSLARAVGTPAQTMPSRLQRADASFELAPNTAMMIAGMYIAILNNTVHLVQFSSLLERVLGNPTCRKALRASLHRGGPEVIEARSKRGNPGLSANLVLVNLSDRAASFSTNLITTLGASLHRELPVIRAVALGVACLAGLGAIAAAAKKLPPVPAPEIVMPVVAGNKADRLPLAINQDTPTAAERVDVVYVQPSGQGQVQPTEQGQAGLSAPAPKEAAVRSHRGLFLVIGTIRMILRPGPQTKSQQHKAIKEGRHG